MYRFFISQFPNLSKITIKELSDKGQFKLESTIVQANQVITLAELNKLSFVPNLNKNGKTIFKWVKDNSNPVTNTISTNITINPLLDKPYFNERLFPTTATQDIKLSYIPTVIIPDTEEFKMDVYETNNNLSA